VSKRSQARATQWSRALANLPRIKILMTTGGTLKRVLPEVLGKILPKPYATSDLLERVQHALAT
jgi:hypothetical protein